MKRFSLPILIALLSIARFSFAQSPHTISYQAYIAGSDGLPMQDANCPVHVEILNADDGNAVLWSDDLSLPIKDGLLNLELGSHTALPPSTLLDHKLAVGVRLRGSPPMISAVTATPYALNVPDNSITAAKMGTDYVSAVTIDGIRVTTKGGPLNLQAGEGLQLSYNEEANAVRIGVPRVATPNSTVYWSEDGNTVNTSGKFLGTSATSSNPELELQANGLRVMKYIPNGTSPSALGGYDGNTLSTGLAGATLSGGGKATEVNNIKTDFGTVGGGADNEVGTNNSGAFATISGGEHNRADMQYSSVGGGDSNRSLSAFTTIAGGWHNYIDGGATPYGQSYKSTIGGGGQNVIVGPASTISGGDDNAVTNDKGYGAIGGGQHNKIGLYGSADWVDWATIGGGYSNLLDAVYGTIGGGASNRVYRQGDYSTIAGGDTNVTEEYVHNASIVGGHSNRVQFASHYGAIGGGNSNIIDTNAPYSAISGGNGNFIQSGSTAIGGGSANTVRTSSEYGVVSGGVQNTIDTSAPYSAIGGGHANLIQGRFGTIAGGDTNRITDVNADHNFIGGGLNNVENNPSYGVIGGGWNNTLDINAWASTIAGGDSNTVRVWGGFIGGGRWNKLETFSDASALAGGQSNLVRSTYSLLGGGLDNTIDQNSDKAVLVGGEANLINGAPHGFLGGGSSNQVLASHGMIGGGRINEVHSGADYGTIAGGDSNHVIATYGTIGGGQDNVVNSAAIGSFIGGGQYNSINENSRGSTLTGGESNLIFGTGSGTGAEYSFIGGGQSNQIKDLDPALGTSLMMPLYGSIAGGYANHAEGHFAALGGGRENSAHGQYATIPGGYSLDARDYQTVIGVANRQYTSAPLLSNTGNPFSSPTVLPQPDDRVFIIGNGTVSGGTATRSNAFEVSRNGHSIVFDRHGTSGAELYGWDGGTCSNGGTDAINPAFPHKPVIAGATYADNVLYAWADVMPDPQTGPCTGGYITSRTDPGDVNNVNVLAEFGCRHIQRLSEGVYRITLDINRPDDTPIQFSPGASVPGCAWPTGLGGWAGAVQASVVCNVIDRPGQEDGTNRCATIAPTRIFVNNVNGMQLMQFDIHIRNSNCDPIDRSFTFQVTGRPTP